MCTLLKINKIRTTALHLQSDGMVERFKRSLLQHLSKVIKEHQEDWDHYIPLFMLAYRSAILKSTHHTPAKMVFGHELWSGIWNTTGEADTYQWICNGHDKSPYENLQDCEKQVTSYISQNDDPLWCLCQQHRLFYWSLCLVVRPSSQERTLTQVAARLGWTLYDRKSTKWHRVSSLETKWSIQSCARVTRTLTMDWTRTSNLKEEVVLHLDPWRKCLSF